MHPVSKNLRIPPSGGMAGKTEDNLKRENVDYVVGRTSYRDSGRGQIIGDPNGFLELPLFLNADTRSPRQLASANPQVVD